MTLDPSAKLVLDLLAQTGAAPMEDMTPTEARAMMDGLAMLAGPGAEVAGDVHREVGGVPAIVSTPKGTGPFPVLVWIHGGGWVIGSAAASLATTHNLASKAGCVVVSLDYRLAPEHKAPAAIDDCFTATEWVLDHAAELNGDPGRVAVGGDSAGGNLSALTALHLGRRLRSQVLVYPATDFAGDYESMRTNADGYMLTEAAMDWFGNHYLEGSGIEPDDPRLSPMQAAAEVIAGAPPALVITAGYDPLRDEGQAYGDALAANGVPVVQKCFEGQIHGFYSMPSFVAEAGVAENLTAEFLAANW